MKLRLTLDIEYSPNGTSEKELRSRLEDGVNLLFGDGLITGESPAEVDAWSMKITNNEGA